jgi:hypothetical protein
LPLLDGKEDRGSKCDTNENHFHPVLRVGVRKLELFSRN